MIQPVYNYLAASYVPKSPTTSRTHKPSELKSLYSHMIRLNQKSPLYKINMSTDTQSFALSLKEASMDLNQVMSDIDTALGYTKAVSKEPTSAEASIIGDGSQPLPEGFELQVHALATPQVNTGAYVPALNLSKAPKEGSYSFKIEGEDTAYEFQFHIKEHSKNQEVLSKLSDFINKSKIGVKASLLQGADNTVALRLVSEDTGDTGEPVFRVVDTAAPKGTVGLAEFYQLNTISAPATNAVYSINGEEHTGLTNQFTLNRSLHIDLKEPSKEAFSIGYGPDTDRILSHLNRFKDSFNYTMLLAQNFGTKQPTANRVVAELRSIVHSYSSELEAVGISASDNGSLQIDEALASEAVSSHELDALFSKENGPICDLINKTNYITINPMNYVDKVLVTYPNFSKPATGQFYSNPMYSGLLFNYYC